MIKDNQKSLNHVQVLLDAVVTAVAYILAWFIIVSGKVVPLRGATLEPGPYFLALIFIVPVFICMYQSASREEGLNLPISVRQM
jgi:hypothetical protein